MLMFGFDCGLRILNLYQSRNSAITYNVDYMQLNTLYPSLTMCPQQILDAAKIRNFVSQFNETSTNEMTEFIKKLSNVNARRAEYFKMSLDNIPSTNYMELIFNLSQIYSVEYNGISAVKVMTDLGICYTIRNFLDKEMNTKNWNDLHHINQSFINLPHTFNFSNSFPIKMTIKHNIKGKMGIFVHSPYELPTTWTRAAVIVSGTQLGTTLVAGIKEMSYQENLMSETSIDERRCHGITPSSLAMFPTTYSQNLCLMECRANYIIEKCQCIPHFYFNRNLAKFVGVTQVPICNVIGLNCVHRHAKEIRNLHSNSKSLPMNLTCQCYPNCIGQIIVTEVSNFPLATNNSGTIILTIEYPPMDSFERSVMYSNLDYAVSLYNVMSAFLGVSILSLCDLIYFFTIRVYWFNHGYRGSVNDH
ncbi:sodium channel protein Nach-like isoform X2 [Musca autumnalis]